MSGGSLGSVINALEEYNEYLNRLVSKLGNITDNLSKLDGTEQSSKNIKKAEERLYAIETEFSNLINYFSSFRKTSLQPYSPALTLRYSNWEDFKTHSNNAKQVSFLIEEKEKVFQVCASKEGGILVYSGELPQHTRLLKAWISRQLDTPQEKIVEGFLATEHGRLPSTQ
jgi:hypothetical protein